MKGRSIRRNPRFLPGRILASWTGPLLFALVLSGCAVAKIAEGRNGEDMSALKIGAPRTVVESQLGDPALEWKGDRGVTYAVYEFDRGVPPKPGLAAFGVFVDVATLGLFELLFAGADDDKIFGPSEDGRVLVSYGPDFRILGLFNEFDALPPDGRSTVRPSVLVGKKIEEEW